jgi:hypothetical protein
VDLISTTEAVCIRARVSLLIIIETRQALLVDDLIMVADDTCRHGVARDIPQKRQDTTIDGTLLPDFLDCELSQGALDVSGKVASGFMTLGASGISDLGELAIVIFLFLVSDNRTKIVSSDGQCTRASFRSTTAFSECSLI